MNNPSAPFFNPNFKADILWRNQYKIRIGPVLPANKDQISRSIKDLSNESIRYRFLGSKKEFSSEELEYLTNIDGWNHYAIGMEEQQTPNRGIAIARLVRSLIDPGEAEIAITIIDDYHRLGLGTLLMRLIVLAASERDIQSLSFSFLPQNEAIIKLIHKIGPTRTDSTAMDFVQLYMDMKDVDLEKIKSQLVSTLPMIENFPLK
jgi:RimJ/RimL family protein N-acetyltransferase